MNAYFNLFLRQWLRGEEHCTTDDLQKAVKKGILTQEQFETIASTERNAE
ncbi:XkdX family protein [Geomicrobium sp. JCM 19038]|nr:XkdX family protein [Geomicrobium sp. JCM 19038]